METEKLKTAIFAMIGKIDNESTLKRIYNFICKLYSRGG